MMMITKKDIETDSERKSGGWLIYAVLSAVFASLTSVLGKIGIEGINSNLGTAIRTTVVLFMAWGMVFVTGKQKEIRKIEKKELCFISLSGLATGASWICYYRALQEGPASVVVPIDKLEYAGNDCLFMDCISREDDKERGSRCFTYYSRNSDAGNERLKKNAKKMVISSRNVECLW